MKKLNYITIVAISLISVAACAADKSKKLDLKLKQHEELRKRFDRECPIPMGASITGKWLTSKYQQDGCSDLIFKMDNLDDELYRYYGQMNQGTHYGPARTFWKK